MTISSWSTAFDAGWSCWRGGLPSIIDALGLVRSRASSDRWFNESKTTPEDELMGLR